MKKKTHSPDITLGRPCQGRATYAISECPHTLAGPQPPQRVHLATGTPKHPHTSISSVYSGFLGEWSCPTTSHPACGQDWPQPRQGHRHSVSLSALCQFIWPPWERGRADLAGHYYAGNSPVANIYTGVLFREDPGRACAHHEGKEKGPRPPVQAGRGGMRGACSTSRVSGFLPAGDDLHLLRISWSSQGLTIYPEILEHTERGVHGGSHCTQAEKCHWDSAKPQLALPKFSMCLLRSHWIKYFQEEKKKIPWTFFFSFSTWLLNFYRQDELMQQSLK